MSATAALPRRFASLVKIEHTVFALPFAYIGALLCVRQVPSAHDLLWITLAMVGGRSLAMGLNRLIDAEIDARNPRTAERELPAGRLSRIQVVTFCALAEIRTPSGPTRNSCSVMPIGSEPIGTWKSKSPYDR